MSEYRISELVARSGFPASTLRFYEQAGLLPAARTPAGYRSYGDDALERLRFIATAKGLGLALEDIRELLGVWEHGVCAHVRTQLRPLVANRISEAGQRIAELSAFVDMLTQVHDDLGAPAPDGACGPGCGCVSAEPAQPVSIELGPRPPQASSKTDPGLSAPVAPVVIACTLTGDEQRVRQDEWAHMLTSSLELEHTPDGVRARFPLDAQVAGELARLASAEQGCCAFLRFNLSFTPTTLVMTVTAPPEAQPILADLFGVPA